MQEDPSREADEMAKDFTQLVDDLAYAKTFYPTSKVTQFINSQASKIYLDIYKNRKEESNRLLTFWKYSLPLTVARYHRTLLFMFIVFCVFFSVGFFSSSHDESFIREVLGDEYVSLTERNIADGNPFGIYKTGDAFFSWIWIMLNNIIVSIKYFLSGILLGVFSIISMSKEAIRIGAFEQFFFSRGFGLHAVLTVSIHGILELTSIIIASGAGVIMGTSYLFPGTIKRWDAFKRGTKDGIKIVVGLIPIFMVAAFFEGFVTRHPEMPQLLSGFILLTSSTFIIWYFIIYPLQLKRKLSLSLNQPEE